MNQREHQLSYCEICTKKSFSPRKGIICGITQEIATFNHTCDDFEEDANLKRRNELSKQARLIEAKQESTMGLSIFGVKNGYVAGVVYIILGILSIVLTVFVFEVVTIWSFLVVIIGIVLIIKAAQTKTKNRPKKSAHADLLDEEL